jgi:hypothetical protein
MALDFPPNFPFHRQPAAAGTRETPPPAGRAESADVLSSGVEARAASLAFTGPRLARPAAAARPTAGTPAAAEPSMVERRRSPRQTLVAKASIRPDTTVQVASLVQAGFVSNISMNGVGFHTRKPMEVGGTYRITLELGPLKWASRLRVISCRHHEESETFDVGGQFIGNELSRLPMAA